MMIEILGFLKHIHTYSTNINFKFFHEFLEFYYINLKLFMVDVKITWKSNVIFNFKYLF